jgi:hypothetical protein
MCAQRALRYFLLQDPQGFRERKKQQVPPLRFAPVGMTHLFEIGMSERKHLFGIGMSERKHLFGIGMSERKHLFEMLVPKQMCHPDRSEA